MGEQDDKIFYYWKHGGYRTNYAVLFSILTERAIQAGSLGMMLASVVWWAQSRGGLC